MRFACMLLVVVSCLIVSADARAQEAEARRAYDGIQAGLDAFRLAEEQRQHALANQLAVNEQVRAWSGIPCAGGTTVLYGYPLAGPIADLDYAYAYGPRFRRFGPLVPPGAAALTVFEPWAYVPGDIYGYSYIPPVRQPIGQWQGQTGPNRWESHPVYAQPLPNVRPLPEVASPLLDGTPYEAPRQRFRER